MNDDRPSNHIAYENDALRSRVKELEANIGLEAKRQLRKENDILREENEKLKAELLEVAVELGKCEDKLDRLPIDWDTELDALQRSNDALRGRVAELEADMERLKMRGDL